MAPPLVTGRSRAKQQLFGVLFLAVLAGVVAMTVLLYQKAFTPVVRISVETTSIGNQLSKGGDVKARGLVVGDIRDVRTEGDGAVIEVALQPEAAEMIPSDARARLLPKTLFGEKFVALEFDDGSRAEPLAEGDVIPQDRTAVARETEQALNDLLPLLQALKPQQVSLTLNALSSALRGRGDQAGANLEQVDSYLREFNPEISTLGEDFRGVADLADNLDQAAPDFLAVLDDLSFLNRSLVDQEQELTGFLASTTGSTTGARLVPAGEREPPHRPGGGQPAVAAAVREVRAGVPLPGRGPGGAERGRDGGASAGCSPVCTSRSRSRRTSRATSPATSRSTARPPARPAAACRRTRPRCRSRSTWRSPTATATSRRRRRACRPSASATAPSRPRPALPPRPPTTRPGRSRSATSTAWRWGRPSDRSWASRRPRCPTSRCCCSVPSPAGRRSRSSARPARRP